MPDKSQMERSVKRGVLFNYICFGLLLIIIGGIIGGWLVYRNRPLDYSVTLAGVRGALESTSIPAKAGGSCYHISLPSGELAAQLQLDHWEQTAQKPQGDVLVTLRFGELYELYLYSGGNAEVFNGYAHSQTKDTAYYTVPDGIAQTVIDLLVSTGQRAGPGDEIFVSTFLK